MLIRSARDTEGNKLGGGYAWRSKDCGAQDGSRTGRLQRNTFDFQFHWRNHLAAMRQTVKSAARTNPIAVVGRNGMCVLHEGLLRRGQGEGNNITQIAMRWKGCKTKQQRAQEPRPSAIWIPAAHTANDKSSPPISILRILSHRHLVELVAAHLNVSFREESCKGRSAPKMRLRPSGSCFGSFPISSKDIKQRFQERRHKALFAILSKEAGEG